MNLQLNNKKNINKEVKQKKQPSTKYFDTIEIINGVVPVTYKKRTALENISNAAINTNNDTSKKSRFSNLTNSALKCKIEPPIKPMAIRYPSFQDENDRENFQSKLEPGFPIPHLKNCEKLVTTESNLKENYVAKSTIKGNKLCENEIKVINLNNKNRGSTLVTECERLEITEKIVKTEEIIDWEDIDANDSKDEFNVSDYVKCIFKYYREREDKFEINDYLRNQPTLNRQMRHLLIDWMVEVQQQLEFNHEVLYLSVKLLDLYLNNKRVDKEKLQLLGGAAMFIACKYEERIPPAIDDFIYVSDNAYTRHELIKMEIDILKTVKFDLGVPLSYTFLRRYAKCIHADMKFLTLARYILELALQEYNFSYVSDSLKACASLYLALKMTEINDKKLNVKSNVTSTEWNGTLIHYTEASLNNFMQYVPIMNNLIRSAPNARYKTIFKKYSHQVFYEVAKMPALLDEEIDMIQNNSN